MTKAKGGRMILMRHGQTEYNNQHRMTGQLDVPLTQAGEEQARAAGRLLAPFNIDKVYASTLSRAFNTAALALKSAGKVDMEIECRTEIIELDTGDFTGRCHKIDPEIQAFGRGYDRRLPGGESTKDVVERLEKFFNSEVMPRLQRGETVLIVAHAGVVRAFDYMLGLREKDQSSVVKGSISNAEPVLFTYKNGKLTGAAPIKQNFVP